MKINLSIDFGTNPDLSQAIEVQVPQLAEQPQPELKPIGEPILAIDQKKWRNVSSRFSLKTYSELYKVHTQDNIGGYAMSVIRYNSMFYHYHSVRGELFAYTSIDGINVTPADVTNNLTRATVTNWTGGHVHDVFVKDDGIWFVYVRDGKLGIGHTTNPLHFSHWILLDCETEKLDTNHCIEVNENDLYIYGRKRGGWDSGDQDRRGFVVYHSKQAGHGWSMVHVEDPADEWDISTVDRPDYYQPYFRGKIGQVATFHRSTDQTGETRPERITGKLYPTLWYEGELIDMNHSLIPLNQFNDGNCQLYPGSMLQVGNDWYFYFKYRYGLHYSDESNNPPDEHWLGIIRDNRFGSWQAGMLEYIYTIPYNFEDIKIEQTGDKLIQWHWHSGGLNFTIPEGTELISIQFMG